MQKCKAQHNMVARRLGGWVTRWLAGWLGGWVVGWLGGWVAGQLEPPPPLPPIDRNTPLHRTPKRGLLPNSPSAVATVTYRDGP